MFLNSSIECRQTNSSATQANNGNNLELRQFDHQKDLFIQYYRNHFRLIEETFYGHIGGLELLIKQNILKNLTTNYKYDLDLSKFSHATKANYSNFGSCFVAKCRKTNAKVLIKPIFNFQSCRNLKSVLKDFDNVKAISQNAHFEKLISNFVIDYARYRSLWYVFEYIPSICLENIVFLLHKAALGYSVKHESEYVYLLYSCNSILDQSKDRFPEFADIVKHLASQLLLGVSELHVNGIVHRDLNPSNIRVTTTGVLKITDFGIAKRYRLFYFDSKGRTENGLTTNYLDYKSPTKRTKLGGSFFYLEPHVRAIFTDHKDCSFDNYHMNDRGFHMDYFSCSMILFEMMFGFTFGDVELYRKYSFYKHFSHCELLFFFSDFFLRKLQQLGEFSLAVEDFQCLKLDKLKNYLVNHENNFIDFLIDGLQTNVNRWKSITVPTTKGQTIDFVALKEQFLCFKTVNFQDLMSNTPTAFYALLQKSNSKLKFKVPLNNSQPHLNHSKLNSKYEINNQSNGDLETISNTSISDWLSDSKSFYIPEMFVNSSSKSRDKKSAKKPIKHPIQRSKLISPNNHKINKERRSKLAGFSKIINDTNSCIINNNSHAKDQQQTMKKQYPSLFFHEIMRDLEEKKCDLSEDITDNELHRYMKQQLFDQNSSNLNGGSFVKKALTVDEIDSLKQKIVTFKNHNNILTENPLPKKMISIYKHKHDVKTEFPMENLINTSFKLPMKRKSSEYTNIYSRNLELKHNLKLASYMISDSSTKQPIKTITTFSDEDLSVNELADRYTPRTIVKKNSQDKNSLFNIPHNKSLTLLMNRRDFNKSRNPLAVINSRNVSKSKLKEISSQHACGTKRKIKSIPIQVNNVNNIKPSSLNDSKALEIFTHKNDVIKKRYLDSLKRHELIRSLSIIPPNVKYSTKQPKMTFVRPVSYLNPSVISQISRNSQTETMTQAGFKNSEVQCNLDESTSHDVEIQTNPYVKIKLTDKFVKEEDPIEDQFDSSITNFNWLPENATLSPVSIELFSKFDISFARRVFMSTEGKYIQNEDNIQVFSSDMRTETTDLKFVSHQEGNILHYINHLQDIGCATDEVRFLPNFFDDSCMEIEFVAQTSIVESDLCDQNKWVSLKQPLIAHQDVCYNTFCHCLVDEYSTDINLPKKYLTFDGVDIIYDWLNFNDKQYNEAFFKATEKSQNETEQFQANSSSVIVSEIEQELIEESLEFEKETSS